MEARKINGNELPARLSPFKVSQLFIRGKLPERTPIAIVGTRRPTPYGRQTASRLGTRLGEAGIPLVSGLAFGIDAIAHQAVLEAGGSSIAVLPCGIDDASISPQTNRRLAERIMERGALVSEYEPGTSARKEHYHRRNGVIAAFADIVIAVEGGIPSGTLITARHAAELSRDLWAVPGPITSEVSAATNRLISEGAKPLIDIGEFCQELGIKPRKTTSHPLLRYLGNQEITIDHLIELSGLAPGEAEREITLLELKGTLRRSGPGRVVRA